MDRVYRVHMTPMQIQALIAVGLAVLVFTLISVWLTAYRAGYRAGQRRRRSPYMTGYEAFLVDKWGQEPPNPEKLPKLLMGDTQKLHLHPFQDQFRRNS